MPPPAPPPPPTPQQILTQFLAFGLLAPALGYQPYGLPTFTPYPSFAYGYAPFPAFPGFWPAPRWGYPPPGPWNYWRPW